ncbi:MAG TPA: BACON domain-containing carbohydrate-binding protein [Verrucomicrobiae bacterium]|jgi:DNA-binding beta-propeller fold protein YncE
MKAIVTLFSILCTSVTMMAQTYSLGTSAIVEVPSAGTDSVVLAVSPPNTIWTATTNANWLHLDAADQGGTGSTNVTFTFDANAGATRTGTLTIGSQTLTITQAGSTYVAANPVTTLVSSGLNSPSGVAVDSSGNVYIADFGNSAIKEWNAASNTVTTLVSGAGEPYGIAVDSSGNVYIADTYNNTVKEWNATNHSVTTLVSSGLNNPFEVAVDSSGNVYIADFSNSAIKEWNAASNTVTTLVSSGLDEPIGVAVDTSGNVYIADFGNTTIKEWNAASNTVTTLVSSGLSDVSFIAVDGSGNVYTMESGGRTTKEWNAASHMVSTLVSSGLNNPLGVAVDGSGNVYIADTSDNAVKEFPRAFVDASPKSEPAAAGTDVLPVVLPAGENLAGPFAPVSDQSWLTITGVTNGVVSYAFAANTTINSRTANLTLLGQNIAVTQSGTVILGSTNLWEGPGSGSDSVVLSSIAQWTATPNASWLHLDAADQGGTGSMNLIFTFDANTGATRTGTLTIGSQTLTITQAGSTYVAANPVTTLVSSGLNNPAGVAVDGSGNVYIADAGNNAIKEWNVAGNTVTTLVSSGLNQPYGVAVDGSNNVYIADTYNSAIKEWNAASNMVTTLASFVYTFPRGVAVDSSGNVYIPDSSYNAVEEWNAASNTVTTLVSSGLFGVTGVAVDGAGNVYITENGNQAVKEWNAASHMVSTLVSSGLYHPFGGAVDGSGNAYIADSGNLAIKEWNAASHTVTTLVSSGLIYPDGVAVDGSGNVYIADTSDNAVKELPRAFVDASAKREPAAAGTDALPVVLPAGENLTGSFAPASDQSWLTIGTVANGVVNYSFTANAGTNSRSANITLLGQAIIITQGAFIPPAVTLSNLVVAAGGQFQFGFNAFSNSSYTVQYKDDLSAGVWNPVTNFIGTGAYWQFSIPRTNAHRFFRVSQP